MVVINGVSRCVGDGLKCNGVAAHGGDAHQRGNRREVEVIHIYDSAEDVRGAGNDPGQGLGLAAVVADSLAEMVSRGMY